MARRYDLRLIKLHRSYTVAELCSTLSVCDGTVRNWTGKGLRPILGTWPFLFAASDIVSFLKARQPQPQPLEPGQIFCVACKAARVPSGSVVTLKPRTGTSSNMVGTCPVCGTQIFRGVRHDRLAADSGTLFLQYEDDKAPIGSEPNAPRIEESQGVS